MNKFGKRHKICTFCGIEFCSIGKNIRKTCSEKCNRRKSAYRADKKYWEEIDTYKGFCTVCGKELVFKETRSLQQRKNQKTCSPECIRYRKIIKENSEAKKILEDIFYKKLYSNIKGKAAILIKNLKRRGKAHLINSSDIDDFYLLKIFPKDHKCPIYGHIMNFNKNGCADYATATLDRIDNTKGYVKGNVEWLSMEANRNKRDMTFSDVERFYLRMKKHENQRRNK